MKKIKKSKYLKAKKIVDRYESMPNPPLSKIIKEGCGHFCEKCGSTKSKVGFLRLFGKRYCNNRKCENSYEKLKNI